jgi:replicative superfamily II helicase
MKFHGIYIGIDRYESPAINWLSCAKRDATALYALFKDNISGNFSLLTDKEATRDNIEKVVNKLSKCSQEDVVVFAFSGHGTETHQLVPYDTNVLDLDGSTIHLNLLAEWFTKIPAKQLICIVDCCFSGGMGAKALEVKTIPRNMASGEILLQQISGNGRIILTASKATEKAWENSQLGHGLLTYYLLEALQGATEVRKEGKISLYRLLEYVTTRVTWAAKNFGQEQNPMLLGQITEEISYPVFKAGKEYHEAFPERATKPATTNLDSLLSFGFPVEILEAWKVNIPSLNELQVAAINEYKILNGEHLLVSAPTSSGKTMVGELAAVYGALQRKRTIFLLPLKALVNDKLRHFEKTYGAFGLKTIRATGESTSDDIIPLMKGQYDLCLMTYEKFSALVMANPFILHQVATVVIDEVQMIADKNRGVNLEFILTLLKIQRRNGIEPQIIALSAVIGDTMGFDRWLGGGLLLRTERPVPLDESIIRLNGSIRFVESDTGKEKESHFINTNFRKGSSQDVIIPLVKKLVSEGKSVIVFRETKPEAQACALYLANNLDLSPATEILEKLAGSDPSISSRKLKEALRKGVAFHIADLDPDERTFIEEEFRRPDSSLKVIAATTTLAMGVNTPAEAVIIAGLMHPFDQPYTVAEYKNIVGRAGRLGYANRGSSYLVALTPHDEFRYWNKYITGTPENLVSHFLSLQTDIRSLILRIVASVRSKLGISSQDIIAFIEESFGAFQEKYINQNWSVNPSSIKTGIDSLLRHGLIINDENGFIHTTPIGKLAGNSGLEVESIIRLIDVLGSVTPEDITDPALIALSQITVELDQVYMPINKISTQKEPQTWANAIRNQGIPYGIISGFNRYASEQLEITTRAKKTAACLYWISSTQLSDIEYTLMQHNKSDAAAGAIRGVAARTCDVLPTLAGIIELLYPAIKINNRLNRLLVRLEIGLPAPVTDLGIVTGKLLNRGDYLTLLQSGFSSIQSIMECEESKLSSMIGNEKKALIRTCLNEYINNTKNNIPAIELAPYEA